MHLSVLDNPFGYTASSSDAWASFARTGTQQTWAAQSSDALFGLKGGGEGWIAVTALHLAVLAV